MSEAPFNEEGQVQIRTSPSHADLVEIEEIQREVWGPDDIVPAAHLRAVVHAGGQVATAFLGKRVVGFSYGFLAAPHGHGMTGMGLHSHMVAVRSEGRGLGVGQALKWHQRSWALENGLEWVSWTFDPLQARNAKLNLEHLGALAFDYLVDFYGPMTGPLGGGQSSDRLLAVWQLNSERVARLASGRGREDADHTSADHTSAQQEDPSGGMPPTDDEPGEFWAVRPNRDAIDAEPLIATAPEGVGTVRVAVPMDVTKLLTENPELARRWRGAVGVTLTRLLAVGYVVVGFRGGAYVVKPPLREYEPEPNGM